MTNDSAKYILKGIEILDISLKYPEKPKEKINKYGFDLGLEHKVNFNNKLIFVVPTINVFNQKDKTELGSIRVSCAFEVENFDQFVDNEKQVLNFPEEFETAINSVSISTARGIMYAQFRATFLQNALLPIVDPNSLKRAKQKN